MSQARSCDDHELIILTFQQHPLPPLNPTYLSHHPIMKITVFLSSDETRRSGSRCRRNMEVRRRMRRIAWTASCRGITRGNTNMVESRTQPLSECDWTGSVWHVKDWNRLEMRLQVFLQASRSAVQPMAPLVGTTGHSCARPLASAPLWQRQDVESWQSVRPVS